MLPLAQIALKMFRYIPDNLSGVDRQQALAEEMKKLSMQEMANLKSGFEKLLQMMRKANASDLDLGGLAANNKVWLRIYGEKKPIEQLGMLSVDETDLLCQSLLTEVQLEALLKERNIDFSYEMGMNGTRMRWRGDIYFDIGHLALNMRAVEQKIRPFSQLGLHPYVAKKMSLAYEKQGLILITGITGSGKSTTLDSIIDANNSVSNAHVIIIANPLENIHQSRKCIIRHREVGRDVPSFVEGARQALRQDPDIIVVGEMRDAETISTTLELTDTGHKVFSTLHTGSAIETLDRIIAECPVAAQVRIRNRLADVLKIVISQKLVPTINGKLTLAKEVLVVNSSVKAAIKNNNISEIYQMVHEGREMGMHTIEQDLFRLYKTHIISKDTAANNANNKRRMAALLEANVIGA